MTTLKQQLERFRALADGELRACAFCDGAPSVSSYYIECCGASCPVNPMLHLSIYGFDMEKAIKAWNTRHNPESNALKIAVEALREIRTANIEAVDEIVDDALAEIEREAKKGE